jgi:hypothetical protein
MVRRYACSDAASSLIPMTRDVAQVGVMSEQCCLSAPGDSRNHAVDHPPWRHAGRAATTVDSDGAVEVGHRVEGEQLEPQQEPTQVGRRRAPPGSSAAE